MHLKQSPVFNLFSTLKKTVMPHLAPGKGNSRSLCISSFLEIRQPRSLDLADSSENVLHPSRHHNSGPQKFRN
jgi:hypothetical protein